MGGRPAPSVGRAPANCGRQAWALADAGRAADTGAIASIHASSQGWAFGPPNVLDINTSSAWIRSVEPGPDERERVGAPDSAHAERVHGITITLWPSDRPAASKRTMQSPACNAVRVVVCQVQRHTVLAGRYPAVQRIRSRGLLTPLEVRFPPVPRPHSGGRSRGPTGVSRVAP